MIEIKYTIKDPMGIHARPAGELVKACAAFPCKIMISNGTKSMDAKRIMGVMSLGVKQGTEISMSFDGEQEAEASAAIAAFLEEKL
ncbi:MAG: HPr family phosphocarrier protein [Saccharofermentans sp.]|nr:HPr family phosphocarrier protein [Saccharofermentans sp.]